MTDSHEPEPYYANSDSCPHTEPDDAINSDAWEAWSGQHPACNDGRLCLEMPLGPGCPACSDQVGDMVLWSRCRSRDHMRPTAGVVPNPGFEHQPVTVWVGGLDCLERECDDYFDEDGEDIPGVDRCSHIREEQACSCQRQADGEYSSDPCTARIPTP